MSLVSPTMPKFKIITPANGEMLALCDFKTFDDILLLFPEFLHRLIHKTYIDDQYNL